MFMLVLPVTFNMYDQLGDDFFHNVFLWGKEANFYHMGLGVFTEQYFNLKKCNAELFLILR